MFDHPEPPSVLDALVAPADVAAWAAIASPGSDVVAPLAAIDPARIDGAARIDLLVGLERQIAWLQACQQRVLAALDGEALSWAGEESIDFTHEQVGAALRLSPGTAASRLAVTRALTDRLPATSKRLACGELTYIQARKPAEAAGPFEDATCGVIEEKMLRRGGQQTQSQFTATLRRTVLSADPHSAEQRHADTLAERRVAITPADDGMTQLSALLPADGATLISCVLDAPAVKVPGEIRSADQRRADALVDVFTHVIADPNLPEQHGTRPSVQVTVAASTLLGTDNQPGELTGHGPITAQQARRIAADQSRHLAAATHRPRHRHAARPRPHHLPPTPRPRRLRHRPRPHLRLPHLPTQRTPLRPRPRPALRRRRPNQRRQPCAAEAVARIAPNTKPTRPSPDNPTAATTGPAPPDTTMPSSHRPTRPAVVSDRLRPAAAQIPAATLTARPVSTVARWLR
jgi:hypothetical protein